MSDLSFRDAIRSALLEELERDDRVIFFGEDVAAAGGVFATSDGLATRFGNSRVFDTPISELALAGAAYGAAITGSRPVVEIMFGDFLALAMDSLINQMSKYWFLTGERVSCPIVIRSVVGGGGRFGAIHSQMPIAWILGIPGIKIAAPANPSDAKWLLKHAVRDENPVVFLEHKRLYTSKGDVSDVPEAPLGSARIVRAGRDITLVGAMKSVTDCLTAAEILEAEGVSAEVIDLRTLRPLDLSTITSSVTRTNRIAVVEEGPLTGGWAGEVLASVAEHALGDLDDLWRITTADAPVPYSPPLEDAFFPSVERIVSEVLGRVRRQ